VLIDVTGVTGLSNVLEALRRIDACDADQRGQSGGQDSLLIGIGRWRLGPQRLDCVAEIAVRHITCLSLLSREILRKCREHRGLITPDKR
jgi:hypothetical protein